MKKPKSHQQRIDLKKKPNRQSSTPLSPTYNNLAVDQQLPARLQHLPQSELLQLQRQVGNQALGRLLRDNEAPPELNQNSRQTSTRLAGPGVVQLWPLTSIQTASTLSLNSLPRRVQRDEAKGDTLTPAGNNYELKVERKGDRWSFNLAFAISRAKPNPLKDKAGPASGQIGDSKISRTRSYKTGAVSSANSMAAALAKGALDVAELMPGVTVKVETKALEAKLEEGAVDVDIFKLAFVVDGNLTKLIQGSPVGDEIMATELGEAILEGMTIKLTGKIEVKIDPSDAARLVRMVQLNKAMAENAEAAAKAKQKLDALEEESKQIRDQLKKRGSKLKGQARKQLKDRLKRNGQKIRELGKAIADNNKATKVLRKSYQGVVKGLKSKAGRLMGEAVKRVGGKILLKLIPGVNIITTALDIIEISVALYKLFTGKAKLGFGGGSGGEGTEGEDGQTGAEPAAEGEAGQGESSSTGVVEGGDGGEGAELGPEIEIEEEVAYEPASGLAEGKPGAKPQLSPPAQTIWQTIKSKTGQGVEFTRDDLAQLNNTIPDDLTSGELAALLEWLKQAKGKELQDAFAILGAIQDYISQMRSPEPITTVTAEGETEEIAIPADEEPQAEAQRPDQEAIRDHIAGVKQLMEEANINFYATLDDKMEIAKVKEGTALQGWMTIRNKSNFFAGYAMMIIVKVIGPGQYDIRTQPTVIYDEMGQQYGVLRSVTVPVKASLGGQSANGKSK